MVFSCLQHWEQHAEHRANMPQYRYIDPRHSETWKGPDLCSICFWQNIRIRDEHSRPRNITSSPPLRDNYSFCECFLHEPQYPPQHGYPISSSENRSRTSGAKQHLPNLKTSRESRPGKFTRTLVHADAGKLEEDPLLGFGGCFLTWIGRWIFFCFWRRLSITDSRMASTLETTSSLSAVVGWPIAGVLLVSISICGSSSSRLCKEGWL